MSSIPLSWERDSYYTRKLDERHASAEARSLLIEDIADTYRTALLRGHGLVPCWNRSESVAQVVSEELMDAPGNVLHDILELIRDRANAGDAKALAIVQRLTFEHAVNTVELRERAA